MRFLRVTLALTLMLIAFKGPSANYLHAWRFSTDTGGGGYCECKTCPVIAPATLFALVALGAIIAIAIKAEEENEHAHAH